MSPSCRASKSPMNGQRRGTHDTNKPWRTVGQSDQKEGKEMSRKTRLFIVFVIAVALISGQASAQKAAAPRTLDIGIATPLTGPAAHLGANIRNGALFAIEDQNAQGGVTIAGQKYLLKPIVMDTKMNAATGKVVTERLVYEKKVKVVIGPLSIW